MTRKPPWHLVRILFGRALFHWLSSLKCVSGSSWFYCLIKVASLGNDNSWTISPWSRNLSSSFSISSQKVLLCALGVWVKWELQILGILKSYVLKRVHRQMPMVSNFGTFWCLAAWLNTKCKHSKVERKNWNTFFPLWYIFPWRHHEVKLFVIVVNFPG